MPAVRGDTAANITTGLAPNRSTDCWARKGNTPGLPLSNAKEVKPAVAATARTNAYEMLVTCIPTGTSNAKESKSVPPAPNIDVPDTVFTLTSSVNAVGAGRF